MWKPWEPNREFCTKEVLIETFVIALGPEYYEQEIFGKVKDYDFFKITKDNEVDSVEMSFYKRVLDEDKYQAEKVKYERDIVEYNKWVEKEIKDKEQKIKWLQSELDRLSKRE